MNVPLLVVAILFFSASLDLNPFDYAMQVTQQSSLVDIQDKNVKITVDSDVSASSVRMYVDIEPVKNIEGSYYLFIESGYGECKFRATYFGESWNLLTEDGTSGTRNLPRLPGVQFFGPITLREGVPTSAMIYVTPEGGVSYEKKNNIVTCATVYQLAAGQFDSSGKLDPFSYQTQWIQVSKQKSSLVQIEPAKQVTKHVVNIRLCEDIATPCSSLGQYKIGDEFISTHKTLTVNKGQSITVTPLPKGNAMFVKWICVQGNCEGQERQQTLNHSPTSDEIWIGHFEEQIIMGSLFVPTSNADCCVDIFINGRKTDQSIYNFELGTLVTVEVIPKPDSDSCLYNKIECSGKTVHMITSITEKHSTGKTTEVPLLNDPNCMNALSLGYVQNCGTTNSYSTTIEIDGQVTFTVWGRGYPVIDATTVTPSDTPIPSPSEPKTNPCDDEYPPAECQLPPKPVESSSSIAWFGIPNWIEALFGGIFASVAIGLLRIPFLTRLIS